MTTQLSELNAIIAQTVEESDAILVHGVTLLLGDSGGLVTNPVTPPSSPRHPVSSIAQLPTMGDDTHGARLDGLSPELHQGPAEARRRDLQL